MLIPWPEVWAFAPKLSPKFPELLVDLVEVLLNQLRQIKREKVALTVQVVDPVDNSSVQLMECFGIIDLGLFVIVDVLPKSILIVQRAFIQELADFYNRVVEEDFPFLNLGAVPLCPEFLSALDKLFLLVCFKVFEGVYLICKFPTHTVDTDLSEDL